MPLDADMGCCGVEFKRPAKLHHSRRSDPVKLEARRKWVENLRAQLKAVDELWDLMPPDNVDAEIIGRINTAFAVFDATLTNRPA